MESLKSVLIRRDNLTAAEADELIAAGRERVAAGENPEDVLYDDFGLEPDYFFDLLDL